MNKHDIDKSEAVSWARKVLDDPNSVILDLETTGLGEYPENRIVQVSIINMKGQCLLSCILDPGVPIPVKVSKIHGIHNLDVRGANTFEEIALVLGKVIEGKNVVAYNTKFDVTLLVSVFKGKGISVPYFTEECAMDYYSQYVGEFSEKKGGYKWKKLPHLAYGKAHDALNDCLSTLEVIKIMAGAPTTVNSNDFNLDF